MMTKSIEFIGTMVLTGGEDLKKQHKSIDFPCKRYCIIDNSNGSKEIEEAIDYIYAHPSPYIDEVLVQTNLFNAGFSGSINQLIKQNPEFPYWCFLCVDWHPHPGELERLATRLQDPFVALCCDDTIHGYSATVWTPELISKVGLLDENFYPAYYEDNDHSYRMNLANLSWESFYLSHFHKASSTLYSNKKFVERNRTTFPLNYEYYLKKWGGKPGMEVFKSPFKSGYSLDYWPYNPQRIVNQKWH